MKKNVGGMDKILRIVLGVVIIGAGVYFNSWWGAIGALPLITGLVGRCGLYYPMGVSTCPMEEAKK